MINRRTLGAVAALIAVAAPAFAHTALKSSTPSSGSVLGASPASVTLEFAEAVRLTSVRVEGPDGAKRRLGFTPRAAAVRFTTAPPELAPGRNSVHWTALSPDGHVVEGQIILVVRSAP